MTTETMEEYVVLMVKTFTGVSINAFDKEEDAQKFYDEHKEDERLKGISLYKKVK